MEKISVIVPSYNEEENIIPFYEETVKVSKEIKGVDLEIIYVDDGSSDKTLSILKDLSEKDKRVKYLSFSRNFGKEAAMIAGLTHAKGDYVTFMDADLQDPPSLLPKMYKILKEEDYDSVAARRSNRKGEKKIRSFLSKKFYSVMNELTHLDIKSGARDYRLMKRPMVDALLSMQENKRFTKGMFSYVGFKTKWINYPNVNRHAGETKWSLKALFTYAFDGIISFSTKPLKLSLFASILFFIAFIALLISFIVISVKKGFNSILFFSMLITYITHLIFLIIAVSNKYLEIIYLEVKNRPKYVIRESSDDK